MTKEKLLSNKRNFFFEAEVWFDVNQVAENVWAIREPHHDQDVVSYFVNGKNRDVLVDSGMGLADINKSFPLAHRQPNKPLTVLLTHAHWDHMGGAASFSDVRVIDNPFETSRIKTGWKPGEAPGFEKEYFINIQVPDTFPSGQFEILGAPQLKTFKDDDSIDLGNDVLRVINTPGHTPGSTSFYLDGAGHLFTGDTLYLGPLYLHMPESNYVDFLRSIKQLSPLADRLKMVFPAHNDTSLSPDKFREMIRLIQRNRAHDFIEEGIDDYGFYKKFGWNMRDMGENRTFSLLLPPSVK